MKRKRIAASLMVLALAASIAGCGTNGSDTDTSTNAEQNIEIEETLAGEITIYTSQPEQDIQAFIQVFNEKQPDITVNVFRSGTEEVVSKILAEKQTNSVQADLLLVADAATFESLKAEDLLMSYKSPELKGISSDYYDSENTYTGTKIISTGIIVNTDLVTKEITSFADLTANEFKDSVIMPSPLYSGAAAYNLGVITRTSGLGWEFYENLKANGVTVDKGNGAVQKAVIAGQKSCGIIVDYMAIRSKADGAAVDFIYPSEGSLSVTEPVGIIKGTKNEKLAKAFVDFILSDDGQKATTEIGYTPIKSGVKAPDGFRSVDEITNLTYDINELVKTRNADKEKFSKMFE